MANKIQPELRTTISDDNFWNNIDGVISMLIPFAKSLDILQSNHAKLYDVLEAFGSIVPCFTTEKSDFILTFPQVEVSCFINQMEHCFSQ